MSHDDDELIPIKEACKLLGDFIQPPIGAAPPRGASLPSYTHHLRSLAYPSARSSRRARGSSATRNKFCRRCRAGGVKRAAPKRRAATVITRCGSEPTKGNIAMANITKRIGANKGVSPLGLTAPNADSGRRAVLPPMTRCRRYWVWLASPLLCGSATRSG